MTRPPVHTSHKVQIRSHGREREERSPLDRLATCGGRRNDPSDGDARERVAEWGWHLHRHRASRTQPVAPADTIVGGCVHYFCAGRHAWTLSAPGASPSVIVTSRLAGIDVTV